MTYDWPMWASVSEAFLEPVRKKYFLSTRSAKLVGCELGVAMAVFDSAGGDWVVCAEGGRSCAQGENWVVWRWGGWY